MSILVWGVIILFGIILLILFSLNQAAQKRYEKEVRENHGLQNGRYVIDNEQENPSTKQIHLAM